MNERERQARELMERAFGAFAGKPETGEEKEYAERQWEFGFHMTDGFEDLERLHAILTEPQGRDPDACASQLYGILAHIIPHLKAAFRALDGSEVSDPFLEMTRKEAAA